MKAKDLTTNDLNMILEDETRNPSNVEKEVANVTMGVIMVMAALVGIWGIASLVGGLMGSESLVGFGQSWLSAITGH